MGAPTGILSGIAIAHSFRRPKMPDFPLAPVKTLNARRRRRPCQRMIVAAEFAEMFRE